MKFTRENAVTIVAEDSNFPVSIFANERVKIEKSAMAELEELTKIQDSLDSLYASSPEVFPERPYIEEIAVTPDFHKGSGIPIGTTIKTQNCFYPQAVGKDIGCGMTLFAINGISKETVLQHLDELKKDFRHVFFQGGRQIPLKKCHREAIFQAGGEGLFSCPNDNEGIWELANRFKDTIRLHSWRESGNGFSPIFSEYAGTDQYSYDSQIGSIGGGNHFVEVQYVKHFSNNRYSINKGSVMIMVHSGSLSLGAMASQYIEHELAKIYPKGQFKKPHLGMYPVSAKHTEAKTKIFQILDNAVNFASVNRIFMGLMVIQSLSKIQAINDINIISDSPHNIVMETGDGFIHRKGACRAQMREPIVIPGSMGASSFLLEGTGNTKSLMSSCHGAGRALSRGASMKAFEKDFEQFLKDFHIVTPIDFASLRSDIKEKKLAELRQEAPFAYKSVTPVIETITEASIANVIAEFFPIVTIKA
ncbi:MAG: RtcB family protein [Candidatus Adiutrix sp.]|jgi:tRNA-splicing ligase RtcB|nr:RtcB family protein [Candidatus Adiutrix sp.]